MHREREEVFFLSRDARALQALFERHVELLEDHVLGLDVLADRRRDELGLVAFARGVEADDVRVALDALEELLLHLEAHVIFFADALLQDLDDDRAAEVGLRLEPALLAEVRLGEAAGAELHGLTQRVEDEAVGA